jgi:UDP-N-acetylmuramate: L-alanyl-gamma-D-glutamyl-meso-diaminopimelate ligase
MRIHLIAIGGSAMHNMAIALKKKGYEVSGSDDEIFEPSKSRLANSHLLPNKIGWDENRITKDIDAVILGMHARPDNPELIKAQKLGLKVYSYPEYIYKQSKDKKRVVIAGSHGKTSITSMVLHVFKNLDVNFDYLVGAQIKGFDTMVKLSDAPIIIIEGDEYLSSPIDRRPKFLWYKPHIAVISGIAWDHINVFPTFENYVEQFSLFVKSIEKDGSLFYYEGDKELEYIVQNKVSNIHTEGYIAHANRIENGKTILISNTKEIPLEIFGEHNLQNLKAAMLICNELGISKDDFYQQISSFDGANKRLELIAESETAKVYKDFAHSPSKLKATTKAVKTQYKGKKLIACMELHTFSSLNKEFLKQYSGTMDEADEAIVYFNPHTLEHKGLESISKEEVKAAFLPSIVKVYSNSAELQSYLESIDYKNHILLLMTSGNFDGIPLDDYAKHLIN